MDTTDMHDRVKPWQTFIRIYRGQLKMLKNAIINRCFANIAPWLPILTNAQSRTKYESTRVEGAVTGQHIFIDDSK
jgi:hypothetical protein